MVYCEKYNLNIQSETMHFMHLLKLCNYLHNPKRNNGEKSTEPNKINYLYNTPCIKNF